MVYKKALIGCVMVALLLLSGCGNSIDLLKAQQKGMAVCMSKGMTYYGVQIKENHVNVICATSSPFKSYIYPIPK